MRGVHQPLPLGGAPDPGRSGLRRRTQGGAATRQLSFGFDAQVEQARAGASTVVIEPAVAIEPAVVIERAAVLEPTAAIEPAAVLEPPAVIEPGVVRESAVVYQPAAGGRERAAPPAVATPPAASPFLLHDLRSPAHEESARAHIEQAMRTMLGVQVDVELTSNRRTMISSARTATALRLRLHRMFVEADGAIVEALGRYMRTGDRRASRRLGDFIEAQRDRFVAPRPPRLLRHEGAHHDLRSLFARVEARHFPGELEGVTITWGRNGAAGRGRRRKRSIRLGTYTHDERLIRVHPVLDQEWVPAFFVEYIVFHEMLHHVEPAREEQGRTIFHTPEFRRRERAYPDYERALAWERANIAKLLS